MKIVNFYIENKKSINQGFFSGLIFASIMAVFSYLDYEPFSIAQFVFYFISMGLSFAYIVYLSIKCSNKNKT